MTTQAIQRSEPGILIADAGSTKTEWAFLHKDKKGNRSFTTEGLNALMMNEEQLRDAFREVSVRLDDCTITGIYFYGAGCATPEICRKVAHALHEIFPEVKVETHSDMTGAARALLGHKPGVAAILGTGSNSALYDGEKIIGNIPPLGYILGDEGSGTALGKRLLKEVFKSAAIAELKEEFLKECNLSLPEILENTYRRPGANKFIASLVPFIRKHTDRPLIYNMVKEEFREFFRRNVALYPDSHRLPVSFTGSVAYHFSELLREAANEEGFMIADITDAPMQGLIAYHLS